MKIYPLLILFILFLIPIQAQEVAAEAEVVSPDSTLEEEQVSLGYWKHQQNRINGAIDWVSKEEVHSNLYSTVDQALQGRVGGLNFTQTSGQPLGASTLRVRGLNTLAGGAEPLYVIDGFPLYNDNLGASAGLTLGPRFNALAFLNPGDIESIQVLKDAAATVPYGARGANGVVIINTKKGMLGKSGIEVSAYAGLAEEINRYDLLNASQFANYFNLANQNAGLDPIYNDPNAFGEGTNWQDAIYRNAPLIQNYQAAFRGSTNTIAYYFSATYSNREGIVKGSDFERVNVHGNINAKIGDRLKVQNNLHIGRMEGNSIASDISGERIGNGVIANAFSFNPILEVLNNEGGYNISNSQANEKGQATAIAQTDFEALNPVALIALSESEFQNTRLLNQISMDYQVLDSLTFKLSAGIDALFNEESFFTSGALEPDKDNGGAGATGKLQSFNWFSDYQLKYANTFKEKHSIQALFGLSAQGFESEVLNGASSGFENEALGFNSLSVGQNKSITSFFNEWSLAAYYGHLNYYFQEKYNIGLTLRSEASSRFNGEYSLFPALSFAWNVYEEPFLKDKGIDLRMRASFGISGNQEIAPFSRLSILQQFESPLGATSVSGFRPVRFANESLEIERTSQFNLGFDLGLFQERVSITADFFMKNTGNALVFLPLPANSGFGFALANAAEIANTGLDFQYILKMSEGALKWETWVDVGIFDNEIKTIDNNLAIRTGTPLLGVEDWTVLQTGQPIGSFYGYQSMGFAQAGDNSPTFQGQTLQTGERKYQDLNNDGVINAADKTIIGSALPNLSVGLLNKFVFKGVEVNVFLQGQFGNEVANFNKFLVESQDGGSNNTIDILSSNPIPVNIERPYVFSDAQIEDGSFLRLKSILLGYQFPNGMIQKLPVSRLKIFLSAQNLITITDYSGIDPEVSHFGQSVLEQGIDFGGYPLAKTFLGGISVGF